MRPVYLLTLAVLLLFACNDDESPTPVNYPATYTFSGYQPGTAAYYLVEEDGYASTTPSDQFKSLVEGTYGSLEEELEMSMPLLEITFQDEATADILLNAGPDGPELLPGITYQMSNGQLTLLDGAQPVFVLGGMPGDEQLTACEVTYSATYFSDFLLQTDYRALSSHACNSLPEPEDLVQAGIILQGAVPGDTVMVAEGQFMWELE